MSSSSLELLKREARDEFKVFVNSLAFDDCEAFMDVALEITNTHNDCSMCQKSEEGAVESNHDAISEKMAEFSFNKPDHKSVRKSRYSVCVPKFVLTSDSEKSDDKEEEVIVDTQTPRAKRKSVCVTRVSSPSSSECDDDVDDDDNDETESVLSEKNANLSGNEKKSTERKSDSGSETESDQEVIGSRNNLKKRVICSSDSDADNQILKNKASEQTSKILGSSEDSTDEEVVFKPDTGSRDFIPNSPVTGSKKCIPDSPSKYEGNVDEKNASRSEIDKSNANLHKSERNLSLPKKATTSILQSSGGDNSGSDFENFLSTTKTPKKQQNVEIISSDEDDMTDFIVDVDKKPKTPAKSAVLKNRLPSNSNAAFATPKSKVQHLFDKFTPRSAAGTPAYKREFYKSREVVVRELFMLFNATVFDNRLPQDFSITWNKRMTKTAGFCYYSIQTGVRKSRIELSDKVVDSTDRIRDTLIHELCHAAVWLIDYTKGGHGPLWRRWANKASKVHSDIPVITRCHQYEIQTKYNYECNGCGIVIGRHSKSVDPKRHRCAQCGGIPQLIVNKTRPPKTPNSYALFMKEHFSIVKKSNPGAPHKELMAKLSEKFREHKLSSAEDNKENSDKGNVSF